MNVIIGWILLVIVMSTFITFVFGYDWILKIRSCVLWVQMLCYFCLRLVYT